MDIGIRNSVADEKGYTMQYLYRAFSDEGDLLYVGISGKWSERLHQHERESEWMELTDYVRIERFPDRESVMHAERVAIEKEKPKYNKQYSLAYQTPQNHFQQLKLWVKTEHEDKQHRLLLFIMRHYLFEPEMGLKAKRSSDVAWSFFAAYPYLSSEQGFDCRNCKAIYMHKMFEKWSYAVDEELEERGYYE